MKNKFKYFLSSFALLVLVASCKKDEHKISYEGGTPPVLTASSTTPLILTGANAANTAVKFSWTNPDYKFTTGLSSQDVTYVLQVDTTGANFSSPAKQEVSVAKDLSLQFTVKELNAVLAKLNLAENMPHNVEFRLKSSLTGGAVPLYSNVIKMVITPYLDVAVPIPPSGELYITGDGTPEGWTNNPSVSQKAVKVSNTEYYIVRNFTPGFFYKFLSNLNQWQPQYGGKSATGGALGFNMGLPGQSDPDAIPTPAIGGTYKVTVNFKTGLYSVVKQ
jgi:hypothetical protein